MDNSSTIMAEDYQYEQNPEGSGGNGEKIDRNHVHHVVVQECSPGLGWRLGATTRHQVGNRSFGDLDSQFEQLAMNSGSAPKRLDYRYLKNKFTDFSADSRSPGFFWSALTSPIKLETLSMPSHHGFRFYDD